MASNVLINSFLNKFEHLSNIEGVNEIMINQPNEIILEVNNKMVFHKVDNFSLQDHQNFAATLAGHSHQNISAKTPLLSCTLPSHIDTNNIKHGGERVQIVMPPCSEDNHIIICMRKPSKLKISYDCYHKNGAFEQIVNKPKKDNFLLDLFERKEYYEFIKQAVKRKLNIVNSGGTSTGKTTFTNALVELIPLDERIITLEDAREIHLPHKNKVHLLSSAGGQGTSDIGFKELLKACLRLRPDRILQSEIRGEEAYHYLKGINTGHPGSITTVHADSAEGAIRSINMFVLQANLGWKIEQIDKYTRSVIDVVIQWKKVDGHRFISEVLYLHENI